jgi:ABC-type amino acid transport substrate-binding protein
LDVNLSRPVLRESSCGSDRDASLHATLDTGTPFGYSTASFSLKEVSMKKALLMILIGLVAVLATWSNAQSEQKAERPVVKIASNVATPFIYKEGKKITGYEYEMAKEAFNRMGYDIEIVDVAFAGIFAGLQAEKWDMCISGIYLTKARVAEMDFTDPYNEGVDAIAGLAKGPIQKPEDLKGNKVATETGTSSAAFLAGLAKDYGPFDTLGYDNKQSMFDDLENGRVQALSSGMIDVAQRIKATPGKFIIITTSSDNYMIAGAVRKGDKIKDTFNQGLNSMKKDGTLAKLYQTYLGVPIPANAQFAKVFTQPYVPTK